MADYLPKSEGELIIWLANYNAKIPTQGLVVGLVAGDITVQTTANTSLITGVNDVEQSKADLKNEVAAKDATKFTALGSLRDQVRRIKTHPAYSEAIGMDLGIIGTEDNQDMENSRPEITSCVAYPGYVRNKFKKNGFDAVNMYTRLKGSPISIFLARDTNRAYDDHRPLSVINTPETREDMCVGLIGDTEMGLPSDIVSVVFGG